MTRVLTYLSYLVPLALLVPAACCAFFSIAILASGPKYGASLLYFPGDPPMAEFVLVLALVGAVPCGLDLLVARYGRLPKGSARVARIAGMGIGGSLALLAMLSLGSIAYRFSPSWRAVRETTRQIGDSVLAASGGDKTHLLSKSEFISLQERFLPVPVEVELGGFGRVRLRMAHGVYPYVGVDFGDGRNAHFDPDTMFCTYAD